MLREYNLVTCTSSKHAIDKGSLIDVWISEIANYLQHAWLAVMHLNHPQEFDFFKNDLNSLTDSFKWVLWNVRGSNGGRHNNDHITHLVLISQYK